MEAKAKEQESMIGRSTGQEALQHAISAAEFYMKASKDAPTQVERLRLSRKCQELIAKAEQLKSPKSPSTTTPQQSRELPTGEKTILLRSSKLHGSIFPPWESAPADRVFSLTSDQPALYQDPYSFPFSHKQKEIFAGWKRPHELFPSTASNSPGGLPQSLMVAGEDCDLVQDITTDCSVVASLCAAIKHMSPRRGSRRDSLLASVIYPFDAKTGHPSFSSNGKYIFRMHFNGCFRQVVVDDRLPSSSTSRTLFVVDRKNPQLIWPALLEKAYLKVRGGYDFPGSNSGTDLWVLSGWIPEQIFLQTDDIDLDQSWNRIENSYEYGDVVVTLGTGRLTPEEEETLGLAGEHDYAMMDLKVENGVRQMLLKNPWCDGLVWRGVGSSSRLDAKSTLPISQLSPTRSRDTSSIPAPDDLTGSFWITFEDTVQNFESLYLNWNPSLFTHRQDHHFTWTLPSKAMANAFAHNPQYSVRAASEGSIWILVSRHFQDDELAIARNRSTTLAEISNSLGFMSLYIFNTAGKRVQLPDRPPSIHRVPFVDSPQTLLRFEAHKSTTYTIALAQSGLPLPTYSFTLSFFSRALLTVAKATDPLPHFRELTGSWTRRTAGGNASTASFFHNPQYALTLPRPTPLSLLLCASDPEIPVHVDLVWAGGQRVTALTARDVVVSSGAYTRGTCLAEAAGAVEAGTYTVVVSTFSPAQHADFVLRLGAMVPVAVRPVPADAAGMLRTQLVGVSFADGINKRRLPLRVSRLTRASIVARSGSLTGEAYGGGGGGNGGTAVRVSLEAGRQVLAQSGEGEFRDGALGLRTGEVDLDAEMVRGRGGLWVVVEQVGSYVPGQGVQVDVLTDNAVEVGGVWEGVDE